MQHPLALLTTLWLVAVLARFALFFEIRNAVGVFLDWLPGLLLLVAGGVLAIGWLLRLLRNRPRRPSRLLPALGIVVVIILLWGLHLGPRIGTAARLWRLEDDYLEIVSNIRDNPDAPLPDSGHAVRIDPGPPLRIAFSWGGLLDNWAGVVHDPDGGVLAVNDPESASPTRLIFGGTLYHARHLWGPWYFCAFT